MAILTAHDDSNTNDVAVRQESEVIDALALLARSQDDAVRSFFLCLYKHLICQTLAHLILQWII